MPLILFQHIESGVAHVRTGGLQPSSVAAHFHATRAGVALAINPLEDWRLDRSWSVLVTDESSQVLATIHLIRPGFPIGEPRAANK